MTTKTPDVWQMILGSRTPEMVVGEFDLTGATRRGLDEWLGQCEAEAQQMGAEFDLDDDALTAWHEATLDELHSAAND